MVDQRKIEEAVLSIIEAIGEDPKRQGLVGTPRRIAEMYAELFMGIDLDPKGELMVSFEEGHHEMVILRDIPFYSMCEHHLLPFICDISIGYLTAERVIGVSKLARIAHAHAHGLQMQERLCNDIATEVTVVSDQPHVAVVAKGQHMCMQMRGVKTDATMVTSVMYGKFRDTAAVRAEFFELLK